MAEAKQYDADSYAASFKKRILWFRSEADRYMVLHRITRIAVIVLGASLPVMLKLPRDWGSEQLATVASLTITVLVALEGQFRFGERWRHHRMAELTLGAILRRYVHRVSVADDPGRQQAYADFFAEAEGFLEMESQTFWKNLDGNQRQAV